MDLIEEVTERPAIPVISLPDPDATQSPPPGVPIPLFSQQMWPNWRTHFFTDWRWEPDKANKKNDCPVFSECIASDKCRRKNLHYYKGSTSSFTNFESHLTHCHNDDFKAFKERDIASGSRATPQDPSQPTLHQYGGFGAKTVNLSKKRQQELDHDLLP